MLFVIPALFFCHPGLLFFVIPALFFVIPALSRDPVPAAGLCKSLCCEMDPGSSPGMTKGATTQAIHMLHRAGSAWRTRGWMFVVGLASVTSCASWCVHRLTVVNVCVNDQDGPCPLPIDPARRCLNGHFLTLMRIFCCCGRPPLGRLQPHRHGKPSPTGVGSYKKPIP